MFDGDGFQSFGSLVAIHLLAIDISSKQGDLGKTAP